MTNNLVNGQANVLMRQNANVLSKDQVTNKLFITTSAKMQTHQSAYKQTIK